MRTLLILLLSLLPVLTHAKVSCDSSGAFSDPRKAGQITYEISPDDCVTDDGEKTCIRQIEVDRDYCKDKSVVMKMSCEKSEPKTTEVTCPTGTSCDKGACR